MDRLSQEGGKDTNSLRNGTTLVQPHRLMALLADIAETSSDTMAHSIMRLNADQARRRPACIHDLERVLMAPVSPDMLECPVKRAALAVLWASHNVTGICWQHWRSGGVTRLSSVGFYSLQQRTSFPGYISDCHSVRYPELVHVEDGVRSYGMHFSADVQQAGGFCLSSGMPLARIWRQLMRWLLSSSTFAPSSGLDLTLLTV